MECTTLQPSKEEIMRIRFVAKDPDSVPDQSPALYKTDRDSWLQPWCTLVRGATAAGKVFQRVRVVSEPLSDYQRWAHGLTAPMVDAGEDIRWVPRARVSELMFPGNDFWLFDDELLVFLVFAGNGLVVDRPARTDPDLIARCRASFEAAWACSIPHHEYTPGMS